MAINLPHIDPHNQQELSPSDIKFFQEKGFLVLRNVLCESELEDLRRETQSLIDSARDNVGDPDFWFNDEIPDKWYNVETKPGSITEKGTVKRGVPFRVEYPIARSNACKVLMGHSFVLRAMEQLISPSFIPTWDSMVFKYPGDGVPIKWHRDASAASVDHIPAIDVGFYLDDATLEHDSCLYALPGSQKWPDQLASHMLQHMSADGFRKTGAVPIPVKAGDVLMHNILVLHGSPSCNAPLRRTVYFEYRDIDQELRMGPHKAEYIPLKQKLLIECLHARRNTDYDQQINNDPFEYKPSTCPDFEPTRGDKLDTLRFPHKTWFREDYKG